MVNDGLDADLPSLQALHVPSLECECTLDMLGMQVVVGHLC